ncbi:PQ loop repeat-domain-containing protein [Crucibulum laeve]|uniref:PQ loop repeat-domain-containing protein n=1 Tax=Crucibulum laeve TaxID=68775 RepID=A0A5C3M681_9AGAR|nr:PQ loop repeat-domain-containing protein [Crucibulum laeve]
MLSGDSLSSVLGWISIACWIIVYSPQIYENYSLQSGEGLSLLFVFVWLAGDLCNLLGAVLAGLLPTVIILALYYSLCDVILLCQIYYYRWKRGRSALACDAEEQTPLLSENNRPAQHEPAKLLVIRYTSALLFVIAVGVSAWWLSNDVQETSVPEIPENETPWSVQILGWTSAVLYLGARIPQILKNFKTRCEGLSPALFFFAIFGNVTYSLSICAKSTDRQYMITNASWLAGSALTVFLDVFVLCQFFYYRSQDLRVEESAES